MTTRRDVLRRTASLAAACVAAPAFAQQAVRGEPLRIGQSVPISGAAQMLGIEMQRGFALAVADANARGGIGGRRVELVSYDDAYESAQAVANTRDLIDSDRVFALAGYVGSELVSQCLPHAARAGVPMVAPLAGAVSLRGESARGLWHLRASHAAEVGKIVDTLSTMQFTRIGVVTQADGDGLSCLGELEPALKAAGLSIAASARIARNVEGNEAIEGNELSRALAPFPAAKLQAVVLLCAHGSAAACVKLLRRGGYNGGFFATSLASANALGRALGRSGAGLSITQVVPSPNDRSRPAVAAYLQALASVPDARPDAISLEGWLAGQYLCEALRRCGPQPTRERLQAVLDAPGRFDPGGFPLAFGDPRRQASSWLAMSVLDGEGRPRL